MTGNKALLRQMNSHYRQILANQHAIANALGAALPSAAPVVAPSRDDLKAANAAHEPAAPAVTTADEAEAAGIDVSKGAAALAEEYGIDLMQLTGTGSAGKIIKPDVEAAIEASEE